MQVTVLVLTGSVISVTQLPMARLLQIQYIQSELNKELHIKCAWFRIPNIHTIKLLFQEIILHWYLNDEIENSNIHNLH